MKPRHLLIDARMLRKPLDGFGHYTLELVRSASRIMDSLNARLSVLAPEAAKGDLPSGINLLSSDTHFLSPRSFLEIPLAIRSLGATHFHSPTFAALPYCQVPYASTVHDLTHLQFGSPATRIYYQVLLKPFFRRAKSKMTVSDSSCSEISRWAKLSPGQIQIVPNVIRPFSAGPIAQQSNYWMVVSNAKPHKNLSLLFRAYEAYRRTRLEDGGNPKRLLVTVSSNAELPFSEGIEALGRLDEKSLAELRSGSAGEIFPSLYEGFGRPPVEAYLSGKPVLLSDIAPHRESLGKIFKNESADPVRFVSPTDQGAWQAALLTFESAKPFQPDAKTQALWSSEALDHSLRAAYSQLFEEEP